MIVYLTLIGTVFIIILTCANSFLNKYISARIHYWLWIFTAFIMFIPIWKLIPHPLIKLSYLSKGDLIITPILETDYNFMQVLKEFILRITSITPITIIWCCGTIVFFLITVMKYQSFLREHYHNSIELTNLTVLESLKKHLGIKQHISIRISNDLQSPMLVGLFAPTIYLPSCKLENEDLFFTLLHELIHYKHKDISLKWFVILINAIHWCNPFAYILSSNINLVCELNCDYDVIRTLNAKEKQNYMNHILNLIAAQSIKNEPYMVSICSNYKQLELRFKKMNRFTQKPSHLISMIVLVTFFLLFSNCTYFISTCTNQATVYEHEQYMPRFLSD